MRVLGIDPGLTGGWAIINEERYFTGGRIPIVKHKTKKLVDAVALYDQCRARVSPTQEVHAVVLELNSARKGQGLGTTYSFGRSSGAAEAVAMILARAWGAQLVWYTPSQWKKAAGLSSDKQASLDACRFRFGPSDLWTVKANDGIAEAALLAAHHLDMIAKRA